MTIEYASYQDTKALLTRGAILLKTSEGARDRTGGWSENDSEEANNIFRRSNVILMESRFVSSGGGFHADVP
jgi:hypothetical protein